MMMEVWSGGKKPRRKRRRNNFLSFSGLDLEGNCLVLQHWKHLMVEEMTPRHLSA